MPFFYLFYPIYSLYAAAKYRVASSYVPFGQLSSKEKIRRVVGSILIFALSIVLVWAILTYTGNLWSLVLLSGIMAAFVFIVVGRFWAIMSGCCMGGIMALLILMMAACMNPNVNRAVAVFLVIDFIVIALFMVNLLVRFYYHTDVVGFSVFERQGDYFAVSTLPSHFAFFKARKVTCRIAELTVDSYDDGENMLKKIGDLRYIATIHHWFFAGMMYTPKEKKVRCYYYTDASVKSFPRVCRRFFGRSASLAFSSLEDEKFRIYETLCPNEKEFCRMYNKLVVTTFAASSYNDYAYYGVEFYLAFRDRDSAASVADKVYGVYTLKEVKSEKHPPDESGKEIEMFAMTLLRDLPLTEAAMNEATDTIVSLTGACKGLFLGWDIPSGPSVRKPS